MHHSNKSSLRQRLLSEYGQVRHLFAWMVSHGRLRCDWRTLLAQDSKGDEQVVIHWALILVNALFAFRVNLWAKYDRCNLLPSVKMVLLDGHRCEHYDCMNHTFWRFNILEIQHFSAANMHTLSRRSTVMANRFVHVSSVNFLTNIMCQTTQSSMCLLLSFIRNIKLLSEVRSRVDFHYRTWEREKRYLSRGHFSEIWLHGPSTRCY